MNDDYEDLQDTYPGAGTFRFGTSRVACRRLNEMVRRGTKTANVALLSDFGGDLDALPRAGRADIAVDWDGAPALVIRTTAVETVRFCDVTEEMALAEGEAASLEEWRRLRRESLGGEALDAAAELVFERFELIEDLSER
ncbi:ASCH domain-containing protein [Profundibacterium mesophilum]|uniref:ASCH domain-containing protein n=1 Tax=Profundibacterium mesophilum KAUST100406-0324 TaxID=1037889 RepID=A0A921NW64_9RHOB|nr:ASCH domain-containing protein [Profundibacterium mesophilum]KAF0676451.1 uncharacterized protein PMES_01183 [Profundibacterium mesophilum KAUST100406-0324]